MSINDKKKLHSFFAVDKIEVSYLDMQGNVVKPEKAARVITRKYDKEGKLISTSMTFDPDKAKS